MVVFHPPCTKHPAPVIGRCGGVGGPRRQPRAARCRDLTSKEKTGSNGFRGTGKAGKADSEPKTLKRFADLLADGESIMIPRRQGGPFDPAGARAKDVNAADNITRMARELTGRWLLLTLTVDRRQWMSAEAAYAVCNERVREVTRRLSPHGIHFATFEVQTLNGEGWPHWHLLIWCPDERTLSELKHEAVTAWRLRNPIVDEETGEVESWTYQPIGFIDVQAANDREAAAIYIAKYVTKPWDAVPPWMLESFGQVRKYRFGKRCFEWLEKRGLHTPKHGARRHQSTGRKRRRRKLLHRLASSLATHVVFRKRAGKLEYVQDVQVPDNAEGGLLLFKAGVTRDVVTLGRRRGYVVNEAAVRRVQKAARETPGIVKRFMAQQCRDLVYGWHWMQYEKQQEREARATGKKKKKRASLTELAAGWSGKEQEQAAVRVTPGVTQLRKERLT